MPMKAILCASQVVLLKRSGDCETFESSGYIWLTFVTQNLDKPSTLWIFSKWGKRKGREGVEEEKGEKEGRRNLPLGFPCVDTVVRIFWGFSIFPNPERKHIFLVLSLESRGWACPWPSLPQPEEAIQEWTKARSKDWRAWVGESAVF